MAAESPVMARHPTIATTPIFFAARRLTRSDINSVPFASIFNTRGNQDRRDA
jgi:hypothetical protein